MRSRSAIVLVTLLWLTTLLPAGASPAGAPGAQPPVPLVKRYADAPSPPRLWAHGAVLLDWHTGEVIWEQNAHRRLHPASTTKILTALIAIERGDLSAKVKVSRRAAQTPGSSMYIKEGEVYSLHDLLYGLLLRSGNDAAVAIAEHIAGSVEKFAELMNRRARELGALNSHFVNPHGLTHDQHLSTAYDLAVIARAALRNPTFAQIVAMPTKELTYEELDRHVVLHNTNRLLWSLPGADGVKTGTTGAAGACLVASATRGDQKLISVVLNASNRWRESAELLEWGFRSWQLVHLGRAGEILRQVPVVGGKREYLPVALQGDLTAVVPRERAERGELPEISLQLFAPLKAPVRAGDAVGVAVLEAGGGVERRVALVAAAGTPEASWFDRLHRLVRAGLDRIDEALWRLEMRR